MGFVTLEASLLLAQIGQRLDDSAAISPGVGCIVGVKKTNLELQGATMLDHEECWFEIVPRALESGAAYFRPSASSVRGQRRGHSWAKLPAQTACEVSRSGCVQCILTCLSLRNAWRPKSSVLGRLATASRPSPLLRRRQRRRTLQSFHCHMHAMRHWPAHRTLWSFVLGFETLEISSCAAPHLGTEMSESSTKTL